MKLAKPFVPKNRNLKIRALEKKYGMKLPPDKNTLGFIDMEIHDCRQYLMIATGELKDVIEEGVLIKDAPTDDIRKICKHLKKLKDQCMRMAYDVK